MKFSLDDFLQLDTNGLLAVNGGSGCSSGPSSSSSDSSSGSSSASGGTGGNSGSSSGSSNAVPTKYGSRGKGWWGPVAWSDGSYLDGNGNRVYPSSTKTRTASSGAFSGGGCGNAGSSAGGTSPNSTPKYPSGQGGSSAPSGGNNGGGTCGSISDESAFEKILNEIYKKKNNTPEANDPGEVTGCYKIGYQCDEYVSEILSGAGFDVNEYNVDNPSGKNVNTHIEDLKKSSKKYDTDASELNHGAYVVFMSDEQSIIDSHAALLFINNDGSAFIYDNSSRNFQVGENTCLGGIEKTGWNGSSALDVCNQYSSYEHFYFQKIK